VLVHIQHVTYVVSHRWYQFAVRDLATRFADGRLTNQKLLDASDEELFELLTAVYGIGKVGVAFLPPSTSFTDRLRF
jgi:hypothetical protein